MGLSALGRAAFGCYDAWEKILESSRAATRRKGGDIKKSGLLVLLSTLVPGSGWGARGEVRPVKSAPAGIVAPLRAPPALPPSLAAVAATGAAEPAVAAIGPAERAVPSKISPLQVLTRTDALSRKALEAVSPEGGARAAGPVFDQADGALKTDPPAVEASDQGGSDASRLNPFRADLPSKANSGPGSVATAYGTTALQMEGIRRRGNRLYLEGRELEALGHGSLGLVVYAHPRIEGAVIKPVVSIFGISEERAARQDSLVGAGLAAAGVGPKVLGIVSIPGEPTRLRRRLWSLFGRQARVPDRPAVVKERVYGRTAQQLIAERSFARQDYDLIQRMIERMAEGRIRAQDLRATNIMIGRTAADPEPRAYLVDGGRLLDVQESESREELLESLKRHQAEIFQAGGGESEGWFPSATDPLEDVLREGLSRGRKR